MTTLWQSTPLVVVSSGEEEPTHCKWWNLTGYRAQNARMILNSLWFPFDQFLCCRHTSCHMLNWGLGFLHMTAGVCFPTQDINTTTSLSPHNLSPLAAYVNCRVMVWTTDRAPGEKTQSAVGARLHPLGPNLRADCHSGMLSYWRSLLGRVVFFFFFCDPRRIWRAFWWEGDWRAFLFFITTFYHAGSYTLAPSYFMRPFWR